jgi:hypothetical protein
MKYNRLPDGNLEIVIETKEDRRLMREHWKFEGSYLGKSIRFTERAVTSSSIPLPAWLHISNWKEKQP